MGTHKIEMGFTPAAQPNIEIRHVAMDLPRQPRQLSCYFLLHVVT